MEPWNFETLKPAHFNKKKMVILENKKLGGWEREKMKIGFGEYKCCKYNHVIDHINVTCRQGLALQPQLFLHLTTN